MIEQVLVDTPEEKVIIKWDGTRFALLHDNKMKQEIRTTIFSLSEMLGMVAFVGSVGRRE